VFLSALSYFSNDLAIDLGTANTCVFARGKGIVTSEPSIVAINTLTSKIEAVGNEAREMLGRTPGNIAAIRPMRDGVIADFESAERMLTYFIRKAQSGRSFMRPRVIIGVPAQITQVERRAVKDSAYRAKASEVHLIEEAMAAAIGAGMLEQIPPELSADVFDRGIVITGGGALLHNMDARLRDETGLPIAIAEEPLSSVVLGAGKMLSDFPLLRKICLD